MIDMSSSELNFVTQKYLQDFLAEELFHYSFV